MCTGLTVVVLCSPSPGGSHTSVKQWPKSGAHTAPPATSREGGAVQPAPPQKPRGPSGPYSHPSLPSGPGHGRFSADCRERG